MNKEKIKEVLYNGEPKERRALFAFKVSDDNKLIKKKFDIWCRYYNAKYFNNKSPDFHNKITEYNIQAYKGEIKSFTDIVFRGGAKTSLTKLFIAFVITNDLEHFRKNIKIIDYDGENSKQITTDIYNILVQPRYSQDYPELFQKTNAKREETMSSFTTFDGVKISSSSIIKQQRKALQENSRLDLIYFDDFENRKTLRSAVITQAIWDNMEEARTSLADNGACIYCCNYISEAGNVHKLVEKKNDNNIVLIVPIIDKQGNIAWEDKYTHADIEQMKLDDDDFEGERLCEPSASADILFDREKLSKMEVKEPIQVSAGFKMFYEFDPSHKYGSGHDVSGGVGLDSSTSVFIDFSTFPARVVATFKSNTIKPLSFGDEIYRQHEFYKGIAGIERNYSNDCIHQAKLLGVNLYAQAPKEDIRIRTVEPTEYGWHTNQLTKPKMINAIIKAVKDGLIELSDEDLIKECKNYSRNDMMDKAVDVRLTTRHFDLLMALAIAWQMKDFVFSMNTTKKRKPKIINSTIYG